MLSNIFFNGQKGRLHAKYYDSQKKNGQCVLILPDFNVNEKNIFNSPELFKIFKIFVELEFSIIILSYRGYGRSQGAIKEEKDTVMDASSACDWIQENIRELQSFWIIGIGNGAVTANDIARRRPEITDLLIYRPNLHIKSGFDFSDCSIIKILICLEEIQRKRFEQMIEKIKDEDFLERAMVFFINENNLNEVYENIKSYILENLAVKVLKKVTKRRRRRAGKVVIMKKKSPL